MNLHAIESDESKEETLGHLLTLFKDLASKQQSYSESSWQGKTSFGIVASVMVEDLLTEAEFSLLGLIALLEIPSTAAALLQQIIHSLIGHTRSFDSQQRSQDEVHSEEPDQKKARTSQDNDRQSKSFARQYGNNQLSRPGVLNHQQALVIVSSDVAVAQVESIKNMPHAVFFAKLKNNEIHPYVVTFLFTGSNTNELYKAFDELVSRRADVLHSIAAEVATSHAGNIGVIGHHVCWAYAVQACVLNVINMFDWQRLLTTTDESVYDTKSLTGQADLAAATDFRTVVNNPFGRSNKLQAGCLTVISLLIPYARPWDKSVKEAIAKWALPLVHEAGAFLNDPVVQVIADEACNEVATRISVNSLDLPQIVSSLTEQPSPAYFSFTKDGDEWSTVERFQKMESWAVRSYHLTALESKIKCLKLRMQIIKSSNDNKAAEAALTKNVPNAGAGITKTRMRGGGNGQLQSNLDPLKSGVVSLDVFEQGGKYAFKLRQEDLSRGNRTTLDKEMETFIRKDNVRISAQGSGDLCMQGFYLPAAATCNCPFRHAMAPHWSPAKRRRILQNIFKNSTKIGFFLSAAGRADIPRR